MKNAQLLHQPPLNTAIAGIASELILLLAKANPAAIEKHEKGGGVLWAAIEFLPGIAANMGTQLYVEAGLVPERYEPAELLPPAWATVLELVAASCWREPGETANENAQAEGTQWVISQVKGEFCGARGASSGAEPTPLTIARKAQQLHLLLKQVNRPSDSQPGGAALLLSAFTAEGLARNMNMGLYNYFGMFPPVENPAFLPPVDWKSRLAAIREQGALLSKDRGSEDAQYHFFEGVRWTCAKFRDTFQHLSEPAPAHV